MKGTIMRTIEHGRPLAACALATSLLASSQAAAHLAPPGAAAPVGNTVSPLILTAPEKQSQVVDPTTQFVRERLPTSRFEQYARFHDPVCVKVIGLPAEFDGFIAKRIVEVAKQVKAPLADSATCTPNVNVVFTAQPQALLTDIAKRRDVLFGFIFKAQMKDVATFRRPIQSWYLTRAVGTNGQDVLELNDPRPCVSSPQGICAIKAPAVMGKAGSRLGNDMSSELVHSLVIADANKVAGEKIEAVADYIAVLALSRWQGLERCSGLPTILNLMADDCDATDKPTAATPADLALLSGLYSVEAREAGNQQRASIASAIRKAAGAPDAARR
jgi:hypothetical protein